MSIEQNTWYSLVSICTQVTAHTHTCAYAIYGHTHTHNISIDYDLTYSLLTAAFKLIIFSSYLSFKNNTVEVIYYLIENYSICSKYTVWWFDKHYSIWVVMIKLIYPPLPSILDIQSLVCWFYKKVCSFRSIPSPTL